MRHDFVRTVNRPLGALDAGALGKAIADYAAEGERLVRAAAVELEAIACEIELDMSYVGQTHTLAVPIDEADPDAAAIRAAFEKAYKAAFGRLLEGIEMRVLTLRVAVIGRRPKIDLARLAPQGGSIAAAKTGTRPVWFDGAWADTAIYDRLALPIDARIEGPAILEQPDATTVIEPDLAATVDRFGNLIVRRR
jgi:N-methylhydantoinase A